MDENDKSFAELRELLSRPPATDLFEEILDTIESWTDDDTKVMGAEYAQKHLETWPDGLRWAKVKKVWPDFPKKIPLPTFALVRGLDLNRRKLDVDGVNVLSQASQLHQLRLERCGIGDDGVKALASSTELSGLTHLELQENQLTIESIRVLANAPHLASLRSLDLSHNELGDESISVLIASPYLTQLTSLTLVGTKIGDAAMIALSESPRSAHLRHLDVSENNIANDDYFSKVPEIVATSPYFYQLEVLKDEFTGMGQGNHIAFSEFLHPDIRRPYLEYLRRGELANEAKRLSIKGASSKSREQLVELLIEQRRPPPALLSPLLDSKEDEAPEENEHSAANIAPPSEADSTLDAHQLEQFVRLRDLLQSEKNVPSFYGIMDLFSDWKTPEHLDAAIAYAAAFLESWPDDARGHRKNELDWPEQPLASPQPWFSLVRNLIILEKNLQRDGISLADSPYLQQMTCAYLPQETPSQEALSQLFHSPYLSGLLGLDVYLHSEQPGLLEELARCPSLQRLKRFTLHSDGLAFAPRSIRALVESPAFAGLTHLELHGYLEEEAAQLLAQAPQFRALTQLSLPEEISADGLNAWLHGSACPPLTHLNLGSFFGAEHIAVVASAPQLRQLSHLSLKGGGKEHGPEIVRLIAESPYLSGLKHLDLSYNGIDDQCVQQLVNSPNVAQLSSLGLRSNAIGSEGIQALATAPTLEGLRVLDLNNSINSTDDARMIAKDPRLGKITQLELYLGKREPIDFGLYLSAHLPLAVRTHFLTELPKSVLAEAAKQRGAQAVSRLNKTGLIEFLLG